MPAAVLVLGLDAAEATLLERWAADGALETFSALTRRGAVYRLSNSLETLPGAIWPELTTGRSCGKAPLYYHPRQLHTGEARVRPILAEEVDGQHYYWSLAGRAGRRACVVDQVQTVRSVDLNGLQLFEWGLHDRNFETASDPPELLAELEARHGHHPITSCDLHRRTRDEYEDLLTRLLEGVSRKTDVLLDLLGRESWDLFTATFGETHCVGHQFWHFQDPDHPDHDPSAPEEFVRAIRSVYRRVDEGIGELIAAAGPDAQVLVVASHGMGPYIGGYQLLPEVLVRLGMSSLRRPVSTGRRSSKEKADTGLYGAVRRLQTRISHVPRGIQPFVRKLGEARPIKHMQDRFGCLLDPLESSRTRAAALPNNRCGAIRLNLAGREPFGRVEPGAEADDLVAELHQELMALKDPATGERIVARVVTAVDAFGPEPHPDVPDLMVVFRTDLGRIEACESDRVGLIEEALFHPNIPRSGDHTVESRLWVAGPGVSHTPKPLRANVLDLAPTVLRLLDLEPPDDLDGDPLPVGEGR